MLKNISISSISIISRINRVSNSFVLLSFIFFYTLVNNFSEANEQEDFYQYKVAKNELNRLALPFDTLSVNTSSSAQIKIENGVIFILPQNEEQIFLFISPQNNKDISILVKLDVSDKVMPQNIVIPNKAKWIQRMSKFEKSEDLSNKEVELNYLLSKIENIWEYYLGKNNVDFRDFYKLSDNELEAFKVNDFQCSKSFKEELKSAFIYKNYILKLISISNPINVELKINCLSEHAAISYLGSDKKLPGNSSKDLILVQNLKSIGSL
ncbi:MAG: hypothetical protein ACI4V7_03055 [Succinivibrionaceae bacterium]